MARSVARVGMRGAAVMGLVCAVLWPVWGGVSAAAVPLSSRPAAGQAVLVRVDPAQAYQTLEGWGTSLAWFAHVLGGAPLPVRTRVANLLFDRHGGLGLTVVRYNIGGGENPKFDFMQYRARIPGYEPRPGVFDWHADRRQRWFLNAAIARGANQVEAFSNSPPYWMTVSGSVTGSVGGYLNNLKPTDYRAFAQYLADVVQHFAASWHISFRTVEPFNEPASVWWMFGGDQEGAHFSEASQEAVIKDLASALSKRHLLTAIAAPDDYSIDETLRTVEGYSPSVLQDIREINTHGYSGTERTQLHQLAARLGKDLWLSEYGNGQTSGLEMSEQILLDMRQLQPTAWVYWQAVDMSGSGWGMLQSPLNTPGDHTFTIKEKYYVMGNYSEFIRPGDQFIAISDPQSLAAYDAAAKRLIIVATDDTSHAELLTYDLTDFTSTGPVAAVWQTARGAVRENLAHLQARPIRDGRFQDRLPPHSVTTFVVSAVRYRPAHVRTLSWSPRLGTVGQSASLTFTGRRAWVIGRKSPSGGIMSVTVAGAQRFEVDTYAPHVTAQEVLFSTETLAEGRHVLTLRVTGRRDAASTGIGVAISGVRVQR
jgi:O-glycosyl hydrolase